MTHLRKILQALPCGVAFAVLALSAQAGNPATDPASTHQAADTAGAEQFLRNVYSHYRDSASITSPPKDEDIYDAPLLALMAANADAADGEVGYLDGDPMCDCQDYDISDVRIDFQAVGNDSLQAKASMLNFGERRTVDLLLHKTAKGWRVADIAGQDGSLSVGLKRSTSEMLADKKKITP